MYIIEYTNQYANFLKKITKRNYSLDLLDETVSTLANLGELPQNYHLHKLSGNYAGLWEVYKRRLVTYLESK